MRQTEQEAFAIYSARVERLEHLYFIYRQGNLSSAAIEAEIKAVQAERDELGDLFYDIFAANLGPFDLIKYGELQKRFGAKLEAFAKVKELFADEAIDIDQYAEAFAIIAADWGALEPWREHLRQEIENTPAMIEAERLEALRLAGYRNPTQRQPKRKKTAEELFNAKLKRLLRSSGKARRSNG